MNRKSFFLSLALIAFTGSQLAFSQTTQSKEVTNLIKKKRDYNKKNGFGFRVQLFYGSETKARTELKSFGLKHPKIKTYIDYSNPPYWKSLVGDYKTRLEADRALIGIKKEFPDAIVVPK